MNVREQSVINVYANPDELRRLADKMEERWAKLRVGDPTFVDFINYDPEEKLSVHLHLDQVWFHKRENQ